MKSSLKSAPVLLSSILLLLQAAVPWLAPHYITQDGPSHVYTALVTRDLLLHPGGLYSSAYRIQHRLTSNWGTAVLLWMLLPIFGPDRAEAALASISVVAGFAAISYFRYALSEAGSKVDPLSNFLLNSWFLWSGFYNFYLGMMLCLFLVGYHLHHQKRRSLRQSIAISAGLAVAFFVHPLAAAVAATAMALSSAAEFAAGKKPAAASTAVVLAPVAILFAFFLKGYSHGTAFHPEILSAWNSFPLHIFASARGRSPEEALLVPGMILVLALGLASLNRTERTPARLAMIGVAALSFAGYLLLPDTGFGGDFIKLRLAWTVFLFGLPAALCTERIKALLPPLSIYVACFVGAALISTWQIERFVARAAAAYESALNQVPAGSVIVRMNYGLEGARTAYGFDPIASEPMFHADAWLAVRGRLIDLTDYQALSRTFPITLNKAFTVPEQGALFRLEEGQAAGLNTLQAAISGLPLAPNYVIIAGGDPQPGSDFAATLAWLGDTFSPYRSVAPLMRVFRR